MEWRIWMKLLLLIQIAQDLLETGVYSMKSTSSCEDPNQYPYLHNNTDWRCCRKCPAGTRVQEHCLANKPNTTSCSPCPTGKYQPKPNGKTFCRMCTNTQRKANRILLSNCTSTHNREYGPCEHEFYYNALLDYCEKCKSCRAGFGVERECSGNRNTKCSKKKCTLGKYSDKNSPTQKCENCKPCGVNEEMFRECTATSNYGCRLKGLVATPTKPIRTGERTAPNKDRWTTRSSGGKPASKSSSGSSRSWVMPFFVSAMALLLFMFLVFVIGVTIWCHRHSKKKQEREGTAESPMIESPKTKGHEESRTTPLFKEKPDKYQIVEMRTNLKENNMMLRDVTHDIIDKLATYLNPNNTNNWKQVASKLGFSWDQIRNMDLNPASATQTLLGRWGTKRDSTVYALYLVLKQVDRDDAADVLETLLIESYPNSPRSV